MKGKKCLLFVLLFAVLSTVCFTAFSNEARASYTPTIPADWTTCRGKVTEKIFSDQVGVEKELTFLQAAHDNNPELYNKFRQKTHYIIREDGSSGSTVTLTAMNADSLQFYRSNTLPNRWNARLTNTNVDEEYISFQQSGSSGYVGGSAHQTSTDLTGLIAGNQTRVCYAKGYEYVSPWAVLDQKEIPTISTKIEVPNPVKECSALDFACWISSAFEGFTDTLEGLATALLKGITLLFSVDTETMSYEFDKFTDFLSEKLGFLFYPIEWSLDLLNGLVGGITSDGSWGTSICAIPTYDWGFGETGSNFMGGNVSINWCSDLANKFAGYTRILFPILISYGLILAFRQKVHEIKTK